MPAAWWQELRAAVRATQLRSLVQPATIPARELRPFSAMRRETSSGRSNIAVARGGAKNETRDLLACSNLVQI